MKNLVKFDNYLLSFVEMGDAKVYVPEDACAVAVSIPGHKPFLAVDFIEKNGVLKARDSWLGEFAVTEESNISGIRPCYRTSDYSLACFDLNASDLHYFFLETKEFENCKIVYAPRGSHVLYAHNTADGLHIVDQNGMSDIISWATKEELFHVAFVPTTNLGAPLSLSEIIEKKIVFNIDNGVYKINPAFQIHYRALGTDKFTRIWSIEMEAYNFKFSSDEENGFASVNAGREDKKFFIRRN